MKLQRCLTPSHEVKRLVAEAEANEAQRQKRRAAPLTHIANLNPSPQTPTV